ncbi:MAG TPA: hypothetical protein VGJ20_01425 [Xanthobacteraceae bacterium]|jgi:hypothetical protein
MTDKNQHQQNIEKLRHVERAIVELEAIFGEAPANKDDWQQAATSGETLRAWTVLGDLFRMVDFLFEQIRAVDPNCIRAVDPDFADRKVPI